MRIVQRTLRTPFGTVTIVWNGDDACPRVLRIFLSGEVVTSVERARNAFGLAEEASCAAVDRLADDIARFLDGDAVSFDAGLCAFERCRAFQRIVLDTERRIPRGRVSTYAAIAAEAGSPGAARAAGTALARNPFPLVVPCHRAVRTDGSLGGFQGGLAMKRRLLEFEGVGFTLAGKAGQGYFHQF
jgi:methylated-DNA-[protein]-cysteine S-methyltransferase